MAKELPNIIRWAADPIRPLKISAKLGIAFVGFSALPALVMGLIAWMVTSRVMQDGAIRELTHRSEAIQRQVQGIADNGIDGCPLPHHRYKMFYCEGIKYPESHGVSLLMSGP